MWRRARYHAARPGFKAPPVLDSLFWSKTLRSRENYTLRRVIPIIPTTHTLIFTISKLIRYYRNSDATSILSVVNSCRLTRSRRQPKIATLMADSSSLLGQTVSHYRILSFPAQSASFKIEVKTMGFQGCSPEISINVRQERTGRGVHQEHSSFKDSGAQCRIANEGLF